MTFVNCFRTFYPTFLLYKHTVSLLVSQLNDILVQVVVLWSAERPPPPRARWPALPVPLTVLHNTAGISARFRPHPLIQTPAVLSLDDDCLLSTDEVDFAFSVWRAFPERIVGYPARSHYWDDAKVGSRAARSLPFHSEATAPEQSPPFSSKLYFISSHFLFLMLLSLYYPGYVLTRFSFKGSFSAFNF